MPQRVDSAHLPQCTDSGVDCARSTRQKSHLEQSKVAFFMPAIANPLCIGLQIRLVHICRELPFAMVHLASHRGIAALGPMTWGSLSTGKPWRDDLQKQGAFFCWRSHQKKVQLSCIFPLATLSITTYAVVRLRSIRLRNQWGTASPVPLQLRRAVRPPSALRAFTPASCGARSSTFLLSLEPLYCAAPAHGAAAAFKTANTV